MPKAAALNRGGQLTIPSSLCRHLNTLVQCGVCGVCFCCPPNPQFLFCGSHECLRIDMNSQPHYDQLGCTNAVWCGETGFVQSTSCLNLFFLVCDAGVWKLLVLLMLSSGKCSGCWVGQPLTQGSSPVHGNITNQTEIYKDAWHILLVLLGL